MMHKNTVSAKSNVIDTYCRFETVPGIHYKLKTFKEGSKTLSKFSLF